MENYKWFAGALVDIIAKYYENADNLKKFEEWRCKKKIERSHLIEQG